MNLFVRGGMSLAALLFAAFLIIYARPLLAETTPSQTTARPEQQQQQETQAPAQATQKKTEAQRATRADATEHTGTATAATKTAVKDSDATAASSIKTVSLAGARPAAYTAFSYSLCCRGSSGLGVRRGTIAADPRILPYGTRVYMTGAGSYDGEYLVTDSGTAIKGNKIDVWVPTIKEARRFGRKNVKLTVLSYGARRAKAKR